MSDCIFCKIIAGEIPSERVYEDENIVAMRDINPQAPVHILLLPKEHITGIAELEKKHRDLMGDMLLAAAAVAEEAGLAADGYRLVVNCGEAGGQEVPHLHIHLLGGRQMQWPPG